MSDEPEGYRRLGALAVYFVDVHQGSSSDSRKCVGIGPARYPEIMLPAADALILLAWLTEQREALERWAKDEQP